MKSLSLLVCMVISACASYPQDITEQATYHSAKAAEAFRKGEKNNASIQINAALDRPTGDQRIREVFRSNPKGRDYYFEYLSSMVDEVTSPKAASRTYGRLSTAKAANIFSNEQVTILFAKLNSAVINGNASGKILFEIADDTKLFPDLSTEVQQNIILDRTISTLQSKDTDRRPVEALMAHAARKGVDSAEGKRIGSLLPTMNIRSSELDAVAKVYPVYAQNRLNELTTLVYLRLQNGDRLLADDVSKALRTRIKGIQWVNAPGPKVVTVVVERLRNDERTLPEKTQTITYAQDEVNLVDATLFMPRNAAYLFDLSTGGAEIEYGFVVGASHGDKQIFEEVVRGKVSGEYRKCQNSRIKNVFGGVTSAGFVANSDMAQRCSRPTERSIEDLRREVLGKVVESVLKIQPIRNAHESY